MLGYMYGKLRELPGTSEEVLSLFKAADKYDVPGLVTECMHMFRRITQAADVAPLLEVRLPLGACQPVSTCSSG